MCLLVLGQETEVNQGGTALFLLLPPLFLRAQESCLCLNCFAMLLLSYRE